MSNQQSMNQQMEKEGGKPAIVKKIGNTTYKVTIHFSNTSQETVGDKIKRLILDDCRKIS